MTSRNVGTIDFLPVSPWVVRPTDVRPPLQGDVSANFAVVGAGYTGLSAALALNEENPDDDHRVLGVRCNWPRRSGAARRGDSR